MSKQNALVIAAVAVSAAIVALAWTLGGTPTPRVNDGLAAPQFQTPAGLSGLNDQGSPDDASPVQRVDRAKFISEGPDGRAQVFSFTSIEPRSNFVSDFTNPRAELYLGQGRLVVIQAASGTFLHPGNDPQSGSFDRDVVVTFSQADDDASLDPNNPEQIVFRLFLDEKTDFDRDLGRLASRGPVTLTGPAAEFTGQGLDLTYSAADRVIAGLTVTQGEQLRLRRNQNQTPTQNADAPSSDTDTPPASPAPTEPNPNPPAAAQPSPTPPANPAQYYRARFADNLIVRVGQDQARLAGDALEVVFAFAEDTPESEPAPAPAPAQSQTPGPLAVDNRLAQADSTTFTTTTFTTATDAPPALPALPSRSLFMPHPDDVRITWTGPLTLLPLDAPPPLLQPEANQPHRDPADHAMISLLGKPAVVVVPNHDQPNTATTVNADRLDYATATAKLHAQGTADRPLQLDAPGQGRLTARTLSLDPALAEHQADFRGPGRLTAAAPSNQSDAPAADPPLDVRFDQRLRLTFQTKIASANSADPSPLETLGPLQQANFQGNVQARAIEPPKTSETSETPDASADPLVLNAEILLADFAPPDETATAEASARQTPQLKRLTARRNVLAQHQTRSIAADQLVAELASASTPATNPNDDPTSTSTPASDPPADLGQLQTLTATGNVTALLPDPDQPNGAANEQANAATTVSAHQLIARPQAGTLTLLARTQDTNHTDPADTVATPPARLTTATADLRAPRLDFDDAKQSLRATGPGSLNTRPQPDAPDANPPSTLAVAWQQHLHYDGAQIQPTARVVGEVVATTRSPTQLARLDAHQLDLTFAPASPTSDDSTTTATADTTQAAAPPLTQNLQLRAAHATPDPGQPAGEIVLKAQTHAPGQDQDPISRLTLTGPDLRLVNDPQNPDDQYVFVAGAGRLDLEDYAEPEPNGDPNADRDDHALDLAGQGLTLFVWQDFLRLNLHTNDLLLRGDVGMNHQPLDGQARVQLIADQLAADLTENPPLADTLNPPADPNATPSQDTPAEPALRRIQLDGQVRIRQASRRVFADQLIFTQADRNVLLQALPGNTVKAQDTDDRRMNTEADAILWNLDTDRLRVTDYRGGVVPLE